MDFGSTFFQGLLPTRLSFSPQLKCHILQARLRPPHSSRSCSVHPPPRSARVPTTALSIPGYRITCLFLSSLTVRAPLRRGLHSGRKRKWHGNPGGGPAASRTVGQPGVQCRSRGLKECLGNERKRKWSAAVGL